MKLIELKQDEANPNKWMAKYQVPGVTKAKKFYIMADTKDDVLATLKLHEAEIETQEVLTLKYEPPGTEGDLEEPKSRWERFKDWLIYG